MKRVLAVVLALVMVLSLTACGGGISTGKYIITSYKVDGEEQYTDETKEMMEAYGMSMSELGYLEVKDGGKATIVMLGEDAVELTYDDSKFTSNGQSIDYKASGKKITMTQEEDGHKVEMVFEKE